MLFEQITRGVILASTNHRYDLNQAVVSLFCRSLDRGRSRIPAGQEWSTADNFLQKQQKQRALSRLLVSKYE
jgi:hypothetical protein